MFAFIGNFVGGILGFFGNVIQGIFGGVIVFFTRIVDALGDIIGILDGFVSGMGSIVEGFLSLFTSLFPFLPSEWVTLLFAGLLLTVVGIIIKKKVFG